MSQPRHVVLLAGGSGTRFWPLSRAARPKQFLALADKESLIEATWRRARRLAPADRIWVVTPKSLVRDVRRALPDLLPKRIIVEPSPRDTGPATCLACASVARVDPQAIVGIFPTDHVIPDTRAFVAAVRAAGKAAAGGALVCLGIRPDRPATGFGYLRCASLPREGRAVRVERFVEKPDEVRARRFVKDRRYLWNAGMFVWRVDRFLEEARQTSPRIVQAVEGHLAGRVNAWTRATRLSVDYAVMEQARRVEVVPLKAGWDDVGSWDAAARLRGEDRVQARRSVLIDSPGTVTFGGERMIVAVDVPDAVVVDTADAVLVVSRKSSEKVRAVIEELKTRRRTDLL